MANALVNWASKVKVKFTLEQAMKAQKGSIGIALPFSLGARWGGWMSMPCLTWEKDPVPIV
jgi:hypothetical protein